MWGLLVLLGVSLANTEPVFNTATTSSKFIDVGALLIKSHAFDCKELCEDYYGCRGYSQSWSGVFPIQCWLALEDNITLDAYSSSLEPFRAVDCPRKSCYHASKDCVMCSGLETNWSSEILPEYRLHIGHCCPGNTGMVESKALVLPVNGLSIVGHGTWLPSSCPAIIANNSFISSITINSLNVECPEGSRDGILVSGIEFVKLNMKNVLTTNTKTAIMISGGFTGTPTFLTTDIEGSSFESVESDSKISIAAANTIGAATVTNIKGRIALQPRLGGDGTSKPWIINGPNKADIINVSRYTAVFGADYETAFYHAGAFEENEESAALRQLLMYQSVTLAGLILMLVILHQDIFFYVGKLKQS